MTVGLDDDSEEEEKEGQPKKFETIVLNPFRDLYPHSDIVKTLREFGQCIVPLTLVGDYLNYVGNHLLYFIHTVMKRRIFYPGH